MFYNLNKVDDIETSYVISFDDVDYRAEKTQTLGSNICYLVSFKHLVITEKLKNKKMNSFYNISPSAENYERPEVYFILSSFTLTFIIFLCSISF